MIIRPGKPARTASRALTLACMGAALGLACNAHAVSYTVGDITVSSPDAGFSQASANTFYLPGNTGITTFTFGDGRGFTLTNSQQGYGSSNANIVGIPGVGNAINVIAGQNIYDLSEITLRDARSGAILMSAPYPTEVFNYGFSLVSG